MKNRLLTLRFALLLFLLLGTIPIALCQEFFQNGIRYRATSQSTVAVIGNWAIPYSGNIVIPSEVRSVVVESSGSAQIEHSFTVTSVDARLILRAAAGLEQLTTYRHYEEIYYQN